MDRKKPGSLISDTVSLGYGSLPLTVTVSVETHLQSKSFQKPKQDVPVKKPKWDELVKAVKGNRNAERNSGKKRAVDIYRG